MKLHNLLPRALQLLGLLATTPLASSTAIPPPLDPRELLPSRLSPRQGGIAITSLTYSGTGCPSGTVGGSAPGGSSVQFDFDVNPFSTFLGPGFPSSSNTRSCSLVATLSVPSGVRF